MFPLWWRAAVDWSRNCQVAEKAAAEETSSTPAQTSGKRGTGSHRKDCVFQLNKCNSTWLENYKCNTSGKWTTGKSWLQTSLLQTKMSLCNLPEKNHEIKWEITQNASDEHRSYQAYPVPPDIYYWYLLTSIKKKKQCVWNIWRRWGSQNHSVV